MLNMEILMQYVTYALMTVGVLAFLVAAVVQAVKELPVLQSIPTSVVALVVSLVMCMVACVPQFDTMHPSVSLGANFNDRNFVCLPW